MSLVLYSLTKILNSSIIENIMVNNNSILVKITYNTTKYLLNFYCSDSMMNTIIIYGGIFLLNGIKMKLNIYSIDILIRLLTYLTGNLFNNTPLEKVEEENKKVKLIKDPEINKYDDIELIYKEDYIT